MWDDDVLTIKIGDSDVLVSAEPNTWSLSSHTPPLAVVGAGATRRVNRRELDVLRSECIGSRSAGGAAG
jgi:hypothetical protein